LKIVRKRHLAQDRKPYTPMSVDEIPNKETIEQVDFDMAGHVKVTI
jgi:hypothetical protein